MLRGDQSGCVRELSLYLTSVFNGIHLFFKSGLQSTVEIVAFLEISLCVSIPHLSKFDQGAITIMLGIILIEDYGLFRSIESSGEISL